MLYQQVLSLTLSMLFYKYHKILLIYKSFYYIITYKGQQNKRFKYYYSIITYIKKDDKTSKRALYQSRRNP